MHFVDEKLEEGVMIFILFYQKIGMTLNRDYKHVYVLVWIFYYCKLKNDHLCSMLNSYFLGEESIIFNDNSENYVENIH